MNKKNKIQFIFTLLVTFCLLSIITYAQTKSTDIKTINGKKYYLHIVEKGQSLYAIAKTYSMDINSVLAENDDAIDGLKNGQTLKIPFESLLPKQISSIDTNKYVYHKVIKGETLYAITHHYNIDEKTIKSFNPSLGYGLKEGNQLIIAEKKNNKQSNPIETSKFNDPPIVSTYTVLPGETLYSISKKINVSTETITKWNPEAKDAIKVGQVLSIGKIKSEVVMGLILDGE
jgi:LysM repeat protein